MAKGRRYPHKNRSPKEEDGGDYGEHGNEEGVLLLNCSSFYETFLEEKLQGINKAVAFFMLA